MDYLLHNCPRIARDFLFMEVGRDFHQRTNADRWMVVGQIVPENGPALIVHNGELEQSAGFRLMAVGLLSRTHFPPIQKIADVIGLRDPRPETALAFFTRLSALNARLKDSVDQIFTPDGRINIDALLQKAEIPEGKNPYTMEIAELKEFLTARVADFYELANPSLDSSEKNGFNSHDLQHVLLVSERAISILQEAGIDEQSQRRVFIAGILHDIGNVLSRKQHELLSLHIAENLFPELQTDKEQWEIVSQAILYHNEQSLESYFNSCDPPAKTPSDKTAALQNLSSETLALIIADKTDVGRHRVTNKQVGLAALGENKKKNVDWHLFVDAAVSNTFLRLNNTSPFWQLVFNPMLSQEEEKRLAQFEAKGKHMVYVPRFLHELHRKWGIPHFSTWQSFFWETYFSRVMLTAEAVFALFPQANEFQVVMKDAGGTDDQYETRIQEITRAGINNLPCNLKRKYFSKEHRSAS